MDFNIEEDNEDVNSMLIAAGYGRWDQVYHILDKKPYLINCIAENKSYAILHQAVYLKNATEVKRLLAYNTCDSLVRTKKTSDGIIPASSIAEDIAKSLNLTVIEHLLHEHTLAHRSKRLASHIPHFISRKNGQKIRDSGFPLFLLEMIMYKETLNLHHNDVKKHMIDLMKTIFDKQEHTWKKIEDTLHQALYGFSKATAETLESACTENGFFKELISIYSGNWVYREVNEALGKEFEPNYKPTGSDLAIGIFALLLDLVLCYWTKAAPVTCTTYRGVFTNVTENYRDGDEIMFTSFVSSSKSEKVAEFFRGNGTLLIMNNQTHSKMKPRDIIPYALIPDEQECLYGLGAEFKVTGVDLQNRVVRLSLL